MHQIPLWYKRHILCNKINNKIIFCLLCEPHCFNVFWISTKEQISLKPVCRFCLWCLPVVVSKLKQQPAAMHKMYLITEIHTVVTVYWLLANPSGKQINLPFLNLSQRDQSQSLTLKLIVFELWHSVILVWIYAEILICSQCRSVVVWSALGMPSLTHVLQIYFYFTKDLIVSNSCHTKCDETKTTKYTNKIYLENPRVLCSFRSMSSISKNFPLFTPTKTTSSPSFSTRHKDRREGRWCVTDAIFRLSVREINIDTVCFLPGASWLCVLGFDFIILCSATFFLRIRQ